MINVGIIGLGKMGQQHMLNCLRMDDVKIVAAADPSEKAMSKAKSAGVVRLYPDYHDLLSHPSNIDAVIISLPNFLHSESVQLALEAGLNVFVEKPMANTVKECQEIVKSAEKSGRKCMPGHCMRFIDAIEEIREAKNKGRIGDLEVVTIEMLLNGPFAHGLVPTPVPEWWFDPKIAGGGVLLDMGYHLIDLYRFFVEENCKVQFSCLDHKLNLPIEDAAILILQAGVSSTKGIINTGWYQKSIFPAFNFRAILHGNAGYLSSEDIAPSNVYLHAIKEGAKNLLRRVAGKKIKLLSYSYYYTQYYKELAHFFDCVENDSELSVSANDGLKTIELIEEAYKLDALRERRQDE